MRTLTLVAALVLVTAWVPLGADALVGSAHATCDAPASAVRGTRVDALASLQARYEAMPGFVDLLLDPATPGRAVAVFDLDGMTGPAPTGGRVGAIDVVVHATRFESLIAPPPSALDPPLIPDGCSGRISPGAQISTPVGGCSLNFLFHDQAGNTYAGTAGHCFSADGQRMSVGGLGPVGTVVFHQAAGIGQDFALVRIDADKVAFANPAMCQWGGPTGALTGNTAGIVRHYGFGVGWSTTQFTRPRTGYGLNTGSNDNFHFLGTVSSGDSGSGARHDNGLALGLITHVDVGAVLFAESAPNAYGTRIAHAMDMAQAATGLQLTLLTAPVA